MPKVPMYDSPTVTPQELPTVRQAVPSHMMEAATIGPNQIVKAGQALDTFGAGVAQAQASVQNAETIKNADTILYGDPNKPGSGFLNQNGQNAIDSYQDTVKALDSLSNGTGGLGKYANQVTIENAKRQAAQHNNQQVNVFQQSAGATRIKAASDGAALAYNPITDKPTPNYDSQNPEQSSPYQLKLQTITAEANSLADLKGINDPDLRADFIKGQLGQVYTGVLSHMLEGGSKALNSDQIKVAQEYFKGVKDSLSPEQQDKIQHVIEAGAMQDKVVSYSDSIMDMHSGESAQFAQIRKDFEAGKISGQEREQIESRVSQLHSRARQAQDEGTASLLGQAQDYFIKNPKASVEDLPTSLYAALKATGHLATADAFSQRISRESDKKYLASAFSELGSGSADDITKLSDTVWAEKRASLSPKDFKELDKLRSDAKQGIPINGKDPGSINLAKFNSIFNNRIGNLNKKDSEYTETYAAVKAAVIQDQHIAGGVFNDEQLGKSIDSYLKNTVAVPGTLWGTNEKSLYKVHAKDIPLSDERRIRESFARIRGRQPTDDELHQVYRGGN